ncbi:5'-flap endonuclease [Pyricularia grisea]|nr:5'-flap endonuclease [Pyricularia grisea]
MTTPRFLPSSPPGQARPELYTTLISSSPDLPSINELVSRYAKKPKPLRSGSNAASVPATATATFTTAAKLLQSAQVEEAEQADVVETLPPPRARAKAKPKQKDPPEVVDLSPDPSVNVPEPQPNRRKARETANAATKKTSGRREESVAEDATNEVTTPTKVQARKVFESPSPRTTANLEFTSVEEVAATTAPVTTSTTELAKGTASAQNKVKKPRVRKTSTAASRKKKAETVSKHFSVPDDAPTCPEPITVPDDSSEEQVFNLEPAVARRLDWTPPRETKTGDLCPDSSNAKEVSSTLDNTLSSAPAAIQDVFLTLQDKFAFPVEEVTRRTNLPGQELAPPLEVIKKRKVIQLVGPPNDSVIPNQTSPVKSKAPKKKPRTITDLATAAYTTEGKDSNVPSKKGSIKTYLEGQGEQVFQHCHPDSRLRKPERKRKPKGRGQVLLSPLSAIDQSARQDFVFGTSSQLAQEQSPTFLRDLHAALKQSNDFSDDPFASPIIAAPEGRKLWTAGARGEEGDLMNIEVIDLVDSPAFPDDPDAIVRADMQKSPSRSEPKGDKNRRISMVNLDSSEIEILEPHASDLESTNLTGHTSKTQTSKFRHFASATPPRSAKITMAPISESTSEPPVTPSDDDPDNEPPPSNQQAYQMPPPPRPVVPEDTAILRPNYEVMTDTQLSKQVSNYGFKSVKKRSAMIALLNQCWESKAGATPAAGQSSAYATTSRTSAPRGPRGKTSTAAAAAKSSPKRPRGRPRKNSAGASVDVASVEAAIPVKRPPGRPKKNVQGESSPNIVQNISASMPPTAVAAVQTPRRRKKAATQQTVEILDSDDEARLSPSPSLSPDPVFSSPDKENVDVSIGEDTIMSLAAHPTAQQAELFTCITRAVKSAPRSTDPDKPSWHEKMLMYDPIVLEDLAAWLNAGQLDRVGYDGEVAPTDVKMWCESKSVCCLWRMSYRGKERKRL